MWGELVAAVIFSVMSWAQVSPPPTGSVEGIVLQEDGKPLAGATVFIGTLAKAPEAHTDEGGRFTLKDIPAGEVGLQAYKESDGYPYDMFSFFLMPGQELPKLEVIAGEAVKNVVVRLGAKAARLKINVTDEGGLPVNATLSFSRPDLGQYGDYRRSIKASEIILVPPVPFRLTAEAKGFEPWHYRTADEAGKRDLITLKSGETRTISITLTKGE